MIFIASGQSKKELNFHFSKKLTSSSNFIFDSLGIGISKKLIGQGHPKLYFTNNGNIIEVKEITYFNADSVFNYVEKYMLNQ